MMALSSLTPLSPWSSMKSSKIVSMYSVADGRSLLLAIWTLSQAVRFFCFFDFFFLPKVSNALAGVSCGNSPYWSLVPCSFRMRERLSRIVLRSAIPSRKPCSRRNSGLWKPSGSFWPMVCSMTLGPANPIREPGSARMMSPSMAKLAVTPPVVGSVNTDV